MGKNVLVVDDERDQADLVSSILEARGFRVDVAYDGAEAIQKLRSCRYDIVVSDLFMPKASGYDVAAEARRLGVRTFILTASSEEDVSRAEKSATRVLRKPYVSRDVVQNVIELIGEPRDGNPRED